VKFLKFFLQSECFLIAFLCALLIFYNTNHFHFLFGQAPGVFGVAFGASRFESSLVLVTPWSDAQIFPSFLLFAAFGQSCINPTCDFCFQP